ncbi:polysaccharide deacetylase [Geoanaerobacter pelophilus]|uniref:Polysaccharide deacetylase n=2 Tax=Geoanaerobacter pelophilus TaxID=60036 RepID=A0ABQ0MLL3_9BACT|nr:polysaccharide deacetylase [Geoanaerobacter pelophilus]
MILVLLACAMLLPGCATTTSAPQSPYLIAPAFKDLKIVMAPPEVDLSNNVVKEVPSCDLACDYQKIIAEEAQKYFADSLGAKVVTGSQEDYDVKLVMKVNKLMYKLACRYNWPSGGYYEHLTFTGVLEAYDSSNQLLWSSNDRVFAHNPSYDFSDGPAFDHGIAMSITSRLFFETLTKDLVTSNTLAKMQKRVGLTELAKDIHDLPPVLAPKAANNYAVVIGIERYRDLNKADYAVRDAELMKRYLTELLGYPKENVIGLMNEHATRSDISKHLGSWLLNRVNSDSTVFVYYAGHGAPDPITGDAYLVPFDGDPAYPDSTAISIKKLYESLGKLPAKQVVVALDSCFSGSGGRSVIQQGVRPLVMSNINKLTVSDNMAVLAASSGNQTSTSYDKAGHGLFTYFLLKGIKDSVVDNKALDLQSLYNRLLPSVQKEALLKNVVQTPVLLVGTGSKITLR